MQIATSVSQALSSPLFYGDSLHETCAKAATVGAGGASNRPPPGEGADNAYDEQQQAAAESGVNEMRYRRMWLQKMTRTGLLFPEESRPATKDFAGFGGGGTGGGFPSTSTSRRGSSSSAVSASSASSSDVGVSISSIASSFMSSGAPTAKYINKPPVFTLSENEKLRKENPALMTVTHPVLEKWHKDSIRKAVGEYGIGVIFVPLYEDEELPVLKPLDPKTMTSFTSLGSFSTAPKTTSATLDEETVLRVNIEGKVEDLIKEIVDGVRKIMYM